MERDLRRDQGERRGCHNPNKITCDGDLPTNSERRGRLKMGQKSHYFYEKDGTTNTYNSSSSTTTACPFHPGQAANTLNVPEERRIVLKSTSMNSLRITDYKTMDSADKSTVPRPPVVAGSRREFRIIPKRSTRSVSPAPSWTGTARRFLGFKSHSRDQESDRGRKTAKSQKEDVFVEEQDENRSVTPSGSIRSRDLSPESLRKFLSDDLSSSSSNAEPTPGLSIPYNIEEEAEDNDDDENFATATVCTVTETAHFTNLSPPPFSRGGLSAPPASHSKTATVQTIELNSPLEKKRCARPAKLDIPRSHSTASMASSSMTSAASPRSNMSQGLSQFSFFDDSDDEELDRTLLGDEKQDKIIHTELQLRAPITSYSLPRTSADNRKHLNTNHVLQTLESPALVAQNDNGIPVDSNNFFSLPNVDISLDDLVDGSNWLPKAL